MVTSIPLRWLTDSLGLGRTARHGHHQGFLRIIRDPRGILWYDDYMSTIAFLTDFGRQDHYAGLLHAVVESIVPGLCHIDLSHGVAPGNILSAAWMLESSWDSIPRGSVVCCVVDPGVGTDRKILVGMIDGRIFVGPDNGLVSMLWRLRGEAKFKCYTTSRVAFHGANPQFQSASSTFEGRDVFAPMAALLAAGKMTLDDGIFTKAKSVELLAESTPFHGRVVHPYSQGPEFILLPASLRISLIHIDHFGNFILDLHRQEFEAYPFAGSVSTCELVATSKVHGKVLRAHGIQKTFADVGKQEAVAYWGSSGFLEMAIRDGSASLELQKQ